MFTARYGLIPYIQQITFRLLKVKLILTPLRREFKKENVGQSTFLARNVRFPKKKLRTVSQDWALSRAVKCAYVCARPAYNLDIGASENLR